MADGTVIELSQLMSSRNLAERLNVTVETLANWRNKGMGPAYLKLTPGPRGHVRYRMADVVAWEQSLVRHQQTVQVNAEGAYVSL
jgi:transposase